MDHKKNTSLAYHPDTLITGHFEAICQRSHKKRLSGMRPYIDSRTNKVMDMPHLRTRLKKKMMDAHKRDVVQYENLLLLNRLSHIMRTKQVDDRLRKEYTDGTHVRTLAKYRQMKWQNIAEENAKMGRRIANAKSEYSVADLKKRRKRQQTTPAANSRLVMPWTLGAPAKAKHRKKAEWGQTRGARTSRSRSSATGTSVTHLRSMDTLELGSTTSPSLRMMPSITSGFEASPASAQAPFMSTAEMQATRGRRGDRSYNTAVMAATTGSINPRAKPEGAAMAAWEEIKSWSIWDMPLATRSRKTLDPRAQLSLGTSTSADLKKSATAPGGLRVPTLAEVRATRDAAATRPMNYGKHTHYKTKPRKVTKPLTGSGTRFVGGDVALLQEKRRLSDGAIWTLKAVEVGYNTHLQDDVMAGFRVDGAQSGGGPHLSVELTVDEVKELSAKWGDKIVSASLGRCRVIPRTGGRLYQRLTSLRITDVGAKVSAAQWEEESNRARYLRRRLGRFLMDRVVVDTSGEFLKLGVDWGEVDEDEAAARVTWKDMDDSAGAGSGSGSGAGAGDEEGDGSTLASLPDSSGDGGSDGGDDDTFTVFVSCMGGEGEAVVGAEVVVMAEGDSTAVARGTTDSVGQCRLACRLPGWQERALTAYARTEGQQGEAGLLTSSTPIDAHILMMPADEDDGGDGEESEGEED